MGHEPGTSPGIRPRHSRIPRSRVVSADRPPEKSYRFDVVTVRRCRIVPEVTRYDPQGRPQDPAVSVECQGSVPNFDLAPEHIVQCATGTTMPRSSMTGMRGVDACPDRSSAGLDTHKALAGCVVIGSSRPRRFAEPSIFDRIAEPKPRRGMSRDRLVGPQTATPFTADRP